MEIFTIIDEVCLYQPIDLPALVHWQGVDVQWRGIPGIVQQKKELVTEEGLLVDEGIMEVKTKTNGTSSKDAFEGT